MIYLLFCFISAQGSFLLFLVQFYFSILLSLCTPFYYSYFGSSFLLFWLAYSTLHVCIQRTANQLCTTNKLKLRNKFDYPDKIGSRIYSVPGTQCGENRLKVKVFFKKKSVNMEKGVWVRHNAARMNKLFFLTTGRNVKSFCYIV